MNSCPWCSQPEGHTGVCGKVLEPKTEPKLVGRPRLAKFANSAHAIIALYDDSTARVWWLRAKRWERGQEALEPLWQIETEVKGAFECITLTARIGKTVVRHEGHFIDRRDAAQMLRRVPSPIDANARILRDEYGGDVDGAQQDTSWQQKVRGTRPW